MLKKILITGGAGDIAKALKSKLEIEYDVYIPSKRELDVSSIKSVTKYFDGKVFDIVVNSAGTLYSSLVAESEPELWIRDINVNLIGTYLISKFSIMANNKTKIINISSTAGFNSYKDWTSYCASKAGVIKLSLGMVKNGNNVIILSPGAIETKLRHGLKIANNNVMSIDEGLQPLLRAINGEYSSGDVVFYRKGECKIIREGDSVIFG